MFHLLRNKNTMHKQGVKGQNKRHLYFCFEPSKQNRTKSAGRRMEQEQAEACYFFCKKKSHNPCATCGIPFSAARKPKLPQPSTPL